MQGTMYSPSASVSIVDHNVALSKQEGSPAHVGRPERGNG